MVNVTINIPERAALSRAFHRYPEIAEPILQKAVDASAAEIQKNATRGVVPWRTGLLTQSFGNGIVLGHLFATVGPTVEYAVFVHEGTRPHVITPKNGKALYWKGLEHPVRSVNHPGTKPNPFMQKIYEKAKPAIEQHFKNALQKITTNIALSGGKL